MRIGTNRALFPEDKPFCPGAGVLCIHIPDYEIESGLLEEAIRRAVPVNHSFGRTSPHFAGTAKALVFSCIRSAIGKLYAAWNKKTGQSIKVPVINTSYMKRWYEHAGVGRQELLSQLGVAQPGDTIDVGVTRRGGKKMTITTFETVNGTIFGRMKDKYYPEVTSESQLLELLKDITILEELSRLNRLAIYWQLCEVCGITKTHAKEHFVETLFESISLTSWEVLYREVKTEDEELFLLPYGKSSWFVCQAGKGRGNTPSPWKMYTDKEQLSHSVKTVIQSRISITCMPIDYSWCIEYER